MVIPGYTSLAEFAKEQSLPYMTAMNHMLKGRCSWPRRRLDGISKDPAHGCWENMLGRCNNPKSTGYENYGGRGISVHPNWYDFRVFIQDIGSRPSSSHSIDRIDVDGNYEPGNVKWSTPSEQSRNTRTYTELRVINKHGKRFRVQYNGRTHTFNSYTEADTFRKAI